jgi:hypothetical protein
MIDGDVSLGVAATVVSAGPGARSSTGAKALTKDLPAFVDGTARSPRQAR